MKHKSGLYVHIPFCAKKCGYCDFVSFPGREGDFSRYLDALVCEMDARAPLPQFDTVYFGGGTPSLPPPDFIPRVLEAVRGRTRIAPGAEITCEANPGTLTRAHVAAWRQAGVNRLSLGAQAADDALLERLGRVHRWGDVREAAALWGEPDSLSLDFMYGLPDQGAGDWDSTLAEALRLRPGHISCYALIVEEGTPFGDDASAGRLRLPGEAAETGMLAAAKRVLGGAGYERYEISNWAREGRVCRHNLNTWLRREYIGIGCAAASFAGGVRTRNARDLDAYIASALAGKPALEERQALTRGDALFEEIMLGFRLTRGVRLSDDAWAVYGDKLRTFADRGLAVIEGQNARLTERGLDVMNAVFVELM